MSTLDRAGIPAMPVNSTADLYEDPHLAAVGMFQDAEDPEFGTLRYPRQPTRFNGRMPEVRHRAPRLGENTEELLTTFGFTREEIEAAMGGGR
jgi:formyl-CoA transferase